MVTGYCVATLKLELIVFLSNKDFLNFSKTYQIILIKFIPSQDICFIKTLVIKKA